MREDLKRNYEHYYDPTPYEALKKMEEISEDKVRLSKAIRAIRDICDLADFEVEGRIVLIDKKTGKKWR